MFVAKKLREQNITGYVIYMFQVEDVIRAYGLDLERICEEYLPRFQYSDEQLRQEKEWYEALIRMMREEGKEQSGHFFAHLRKFFIFPGFGCLCAFPRV